jgi:hypothetical protein
VCPGSADADVVRLTFSEPMPESLLFKDVILTNKFGRSVAPFREKSDTNTLGWMVQIPVGIETTLQFDGVDHVSNFSYIGEFFGLEVCNSHNSIVCE